MSPCAHKGDIFHRVPIALLHAREPVGRFSLLPYSMCVWHRRPFQRATKTYFFRAAIAQEDDGRWSAWIDALPGCATWGYTKEEALRNLRDAVEAYIQDMQKAGEDIPTEAPTPVVHEPVVAITV